MYYSTSVQFSLEMAGRMAGSSGVTGGTVIHIRSVHTRASPKSADHCHGKYCMQPRFGLCCICCTVCTPAVLLYSLTVQHKDLPVQLIQQPLVSNFAHTVMESENVFILKAFFQIFFILFQIKQYYFFSESLSGVVQWLAVWCSWQGWILILQPTRQAGQAGELD